MYIKTDYSASINYILKHINVFIAGVCQSYKIEGDFCSTFDKQNGYCSCNENEMMSCQFVHSSPDTHAGSFMCKRHELTVS